MKFNQISTILNAINKEVIGETEIVTEDLSNIVSVGRTVFEDNSTNLNEYCKKLVDRIGRTWFDNKMFKPNTPNIMVDSNEYGSIIQKIRVKIDDDVDNKSYGLTKGQTLDPFIFTPPDVIVEYFNDKTTFEQDISIMEVQIKSAFNSASEMSSFISTIENRIANRLALDKHNLVMRCINNMIAEKIASEENVINLLAEYNTATGSNLTSNKALEDKEFLKYVSMTIALYRNYLKEPSSLFNGGDYVTFTSPDDMRMVILSRVANALKMYLEADTYHNELVSTGNYTEIPFWQGTGKTTALNFANISTINVKTASNKTTVNKTGVIAVLFDIKACACCNFNSRVTSIYNPRGEYFNYFYKEDAMYMNDPMENCVVFTIEDATSG